MTTLDIKAERDLAKATRTVPETERMQTERALADAAKAHFGSATQAAELALDIVKDLGSWFLDGTDPGPNVVNALKEIGAAIERRSLKLYRARSLHTIERFAPEFAAANDADRLKVVETVIDHLLLWDEGNRAPRERQRSGLRAALPMLLESYASSAAGRFGKRSGARILAELIAKGHLTIGFKVWTDANTSLVDEVERIRKRIDEDAKDEQKRVSE